VCIPAQIDLHASVLPATGLPNRVRPLYRSPVVELEVQIDRRADQRQMTESLREVAPGWSQLSATQSMIVVTACQPLWASWNPRLSAV
jgi:hypothetical protein